MRHARRVANAFHCQRRDTRVACMRAPALAAMHAYARMPAVVHGCAAAASSWTTAASRRSHAPQVHNACARRACVMNTGRVWPESWNMLQTQLTAIQAAGMQAMQHASPVPPPKPMTAPPVALRSFQGSSAVSLHHTTAWRGRASCWPPPAYWAVSAR